MSGPLNGRLTVNESTNFTYRRDYKIANCLNYWGNTDSVTFVLVKIFKCTDFELNISYTI